jgi:hypothetical protein
MTGSFVSSLPVFACLLSGVALVVSIVSFVSVKRTLERPAQSSLLSLRDATSESETIELKSQIEQLRVRLEEVEQRKQPLSDWTAAEPSSLNLNRRGQVLRLYRRGDSVAHIASTLGLSTGEVALIVKVQEMTPPGRGQEISGSEL